MMDRSHSIDSIKGMLILFVVAGHVGAPSGNIAIPLIQEWIYTFHMPAFFMLGCLFIKSFKREIKSIFPLLGCYIFWVVLQKRNPEAVAHAIIHSNWESLNSILWFLPAIISFKLLFSLQFTGALVYWRSVLLTIMGLITIYFHREIQVIHNVIPWGFDIAVYLSPAAIAAKLFYNSKQLILERVISDRSKFIMFLLIFSIFSMAFLVRTSLNTFTVWHHRLDMAQFSVPGFEGYFYLTGMMLAMIGVARIKMKGSILSFIGNKSLSIFVFHTYAIGLTSKYLFIVSDNVLWVANIIVAVILSVLFSIVLLKISRHFRYIGA
jgi:fucose 4-O-acetylase-like acetyltransferase